MQSKENLSKLITSIVEYLSEMVKRMAEAFKWAFQQIKELAAKAEEINRFDERLVYKGKIRKSEFNKQKMMHQVISNKPRHLIRKIIR